MEPKRELVHIAFLVDTNCVNARQKLPSMNQLEKWAENELILLQTAEIAQSEMVVGNNSARIAKAYSFFFTMSEITTPQETEKLAQIESVIFPAGASNNNQRNDVEIVFNASKYCRPLITNDGGSKSQPRGILGNKSALATLGIEVLSPEEAVAKVQIEICDRDQYAKQWATSRGVEVPEWVGQD